MADTSINFQLEGTRRNWIRLRTLVTLRWVAIAGQIAALTLAQRLYGLQLEIALCYAAIGLSVIANLTSVWVYPENKSLSNLETLLFLLFDLLQLSFLLALTGGLNNPFALLVLAPVTISATVLSLGYTAILGTVGMIAITLTALFHVPLMSADGFVLEIPRLFALGFWVAILVGGCFIAAYARRVTEEMQTMSQALLATQMALSREQKLTDLGGVVAAAAHELGTPLATIMLVSRELMEELPDGDQREDAQLIRSQADRCRDILRSMGRAGKDDLQLRFAPLETVVQEAAAPHMDRGKNINIHLRSVGIDAVEQPQIRRQPEIVHGLRNLVQNAVDFAARDVRIVQSWSATAIEVEISDDGPGFSASVMGRLGDPFMRSRRKVKGANRAEYEGMGLGFFIAKTLLERTGATLRFSNGILESDLKGAQILVRWDRGSIDKNRENAKEASGVNANIVS